jgi:hypothetical protein
MSNQGLSKVLLSMFGFVSLMAVSVSVHGESATLFGKQGPYQVKMSEVADQGLLLVPHSDDENAGKNVLAVTRKALLLGFCRDRQSTARRLWCDEYAEADAVARCGA